MGSNDRNQKRLRSLGEGLLALLADESGQATTEYVILIAVLVGIILSVGLAMRNRIQSLFKGAVGNVLRTQFFSPDGMHKCQFVCNAGK